MACNPAAIPTATGIILSLLLGLIPSSTKLVGVGGRERRGVVGTGLGVERDRGARVQMMHIHFPVLYFIAYSLVPAR